MSMVTLIASLGLGSNFPPGHIGPGILEVLAFLQAQSRVSLGVGGFAVDFLHCAGRWTR